jgi:CBS domain-containing protein
MTINPVTVGRADWRRAALTMYSPLSAILRHPPITVPLEASLRLTLEAMARQDVDTAVVVDPASRVPLGTFTLRDLVHRVALPGEGLDQPVAGVMTGGLLTMGPSATAHEAALTMARLGVRTLVVVDGAGRLLGAVSRDDLFGLQRAGVDEVSEQIQAARDPEALQAAAAGIRRLAERLLAQGTGAESLLHFITTLNDLLTIRIIETVADERALPGVAWCWIAMGSEGRLEQTFSTDQDNAIILDAEAADGEELRKAFVPFGRAVNERLRACGFPLCNGEYMAGNARWCLTLGEWRRAVAGWIEVPEPEALVHASTLLDFRPVYGQAALAERLRQPVLAMVADHTLFLRQLAAAAVEIRPPLGLFGHERVGGFIDGLHFIYLLRLRNQIWPRRPQVGPNRIFPRDLNELDRHVLKEAFRQAGQLQEGLIMEYQLQV